MAGMTGYPMGKRGSARKRGGMNTGANAVPAGDRTYNRASAATKAACNQIKSKLSRVAHGNMGRQRNDGGTY